MAAAEHRLAVVMFTDIVGYTARSQRDEPQALRMLEEHRRLLRPKFSEHHGHEVKTMGDAFLVEFDSALNATGCAVAIQRALYERNLHEPGESIDVRIGIHLGEISHEGGDIHGDAVNVASRVYPLADPGGICLSEPVYTQIRGKLELAVEKLPPTPLKNVSYPVDLYRALLPWSERGLSAVLPWTDREEEMAAVQGAVAQAIRGEATAVMLVGEVGIGKTRLADEAIEQARKSGVRVLRGRCAPGELAAPYAPWVEAFRQFVRDAPPPLLYRVLGAQGRDLARLVPEVVEKIGALPPAPAVEADQARLQFLEGIGQFLDRLAAEGPLILFLDDLHWADPASTLLLRYVAPRLRKRSVLLLGAYRKDEGEENRALRETLNELHREHLLATLPLDRLPAAHVGRLIAEMFHAPEVSTEFRDLVHARTGGNPLLIEEVLRALVRDKVIYWSGTGWERRPVEQIEIPEGVKEIIGQRLRRFDEKAVDLLRLASVIGYEFDFDLVAQLSGEEEGRLLDLVEGLLRGRLIQEVEGPHGRSTYVFADHPTRDVLYEEVSLVRRRRLHLKIAQALEGMGAKATAERVGEIAHHYLQGNDVAKALEYTVRAAEKAVGVFAHTEAYRLYRTALELAEEQGDEKGRAALLFCLGREAEQQGRPLDAMKHFEEALRLYGRYSDPEAEGRTLIRLARLAREELGDAPRAIELSRRAVAVLEKGGESPALCDAISGLGVILNATGHTQEGRGYLERAVAMARTFHDVDTIATGLQFLANSSPWTAHRESTAQAQEGARIAEEGGASRVASKFANLVFAYAWLEGDFDAAFRAVAQSRREAERRNQPTYVLFARAAATPVLVLVGRFSEARTEAEAILAATPGAQPTLSVGIALTALATLESYTGDRSRAEELTAQCRDVWKRIHSPMAGATAEVALVERSWFDGADDPVGVGRLEELLAVSQARGRTVDTVRPHAMLLATLGEAYLRAGRADAAGVVAEELAELASQVEKSWSLALRDRLFGLLARSRGDPAEALRRLASSAEQSRQARTPYEEARTRFLLAEAALASGDAAGGKGAVDLAREIFGRLGATAALRAVERIRPAT